MINAWLNKQSSFHIKDKVVSLLAKILVNVEWFRPESVTYKQANSLSHL